MTRDELLDPEQIVKWLPAIFGKALQPTPVSTAVVTTSTSIALISKIIVPPNPARLGLMLYNNSANSGYFTFGSVSVSNSCSMIIATFANWNWPFSNFVYTGPISCIRNSGTGTVIVTEFSA